MPLLFPVPRYHAQGVLRNGNQLIQLGNSSSRNSSGGCAPLFCGVKYGLRDNSPALAHQVRRVGNVEHTFQRRMNGIKRRGYGGR